MGKSLTTTKNSFLLLFSYIENVMFCWKISLKKFSYITRLVLHIFCVADSLRRSNKIINLHWSSSKLTTQNTW